MRRCRFAAAAARPPCGGGEVSAPTAACTDIAARTNAEKVKITAEFSPAVILPYLLIACFLRILCTYAVFKTGDYIFSCTLVGVKEKRDRAAAFRPRNQIPQVFAR